MKSSTMKRRDHGGRPDAGVPQANREAGMATYASLPDEPTFVPDTLSDSPFRTPDSPVRSPSPSLVIVHDSMTLSPFAPR